MKTTLDIDDAMLRKAKILAAQQGITLTRLIEEGLRLRMTMAAPSSFAVRMPKIAVWEGKGGLLPGIDPTSNRSMLDAADGLE